MRGNNLTEKRGCYDVFWEKKATDSKIGGETFFLKLFGSFWNFLQLLNLK